MTTVREATSFEPQLAQPSSLVPGLVLLLRVCGPPAQLLAEGEAESSATALHAVCSRERALSLLPGHGLTQLSLPVGTGDLLPRGMPGDTAVTLWSGVQIKDAG